MRTLGTALIPPHALQVRAKNNAMHGVVWWKTTAMGGIQVKRDAGADLWSRSEHSYTPPNEVVVLVAAMNIPRRFASETKSKMAWVGGILWQK